VPDQHRPAHGPHPARRWVLTVAAVGLLTSACGHDGGPGGPQATHLTPPSPAQHATASATGTPGSGAEPHRAGHGTPGSGRAHGTGRAQRTGSAQRHSGTGTPGAVRGSSARPLAGQVVGIDPGHNGGNAGDPGYINQLIWNGRAQETCDTTGTQTDGGYTEALFNYAVATFLRADLRRAGARVVMTRTSNNGVGPCVTRRAQIINHGHADVAIDIHADGGPAAGRGFAILLPIADGPNDNVIASSVAFGHDLRAAFLARTSMPVSTYDGQGGFAFRNDLAGLNLSTVPKVLIECGNMRNATDARLLTSPVFQRRVARAMEAAIIGFLRRR
jgi:N-acetylmuramoyl-L-alanine amidase